MEVSKRQSPFLILLFAFALLLHSSAGNNNHPQQPHVTPNLAGKAGQPAPKQAAPAQPVPKQPQGKKVWCVPKPGVSDAALGKNIDFVCGNGVDCSEIQSPRPCFKPNTVRNHAAYVMNKWYQIKAHKNFNCDFSGTAMLTDVDPSYDQCRFPA